VIDEHGRGPVRNRNDHRDTFPAGRRSQHFEKPRFDRDDVELASGGALHDIVRPAHAPDFLA
jgi:hypothetical protein